MEYWAIHEQDRLNNDLNTNQHGPNLHECHFCSFMYGLLSPFIAKSGSNAAICGGIIGLAAVVLIVVVILVVVGKKKDGML